MILLVYFTGIKKKEDVFKNYTHNKKWFKTPHNKLIDEYKQGIFIYFQVLIISGNTRFYSEVDLFDRLFFFFTPPRLDFLLP